jgi:hypothetical protein
VFYELFCPSITISKFIYFSEFELGKIQKTYFEVFIQGQKWKFGGGEELSNTNI